MTRRECFDGVMGIIAGVLGRARNARIRRPDECSCALVLRDAIAWRRRPGKTRRGRRIAVLQVAVAPTTRTTWPGRAAHAAFFLGHNGENGNAYRCTQGNQDPRRARRTRAGRRRRPGQARPRGVAGEGRRHQERLQGRAVHPARREDRAGRRGAVRKGRADRQGQGADRGRPAALLRKDHLLFCYLHLAPLPGADEAPARHRPDRHRVRDRRAANGDLPLLAPMSIIAGKIARAGRHPPAAPARRRQGQAARRPAVDRARQGRGVRRRRRPVAIRRRWPRPAARTWSCSRSARTAWKR